MFQTKKQKQKKHLFKADLSTANTRQAKKKNLVLFN
jgi:hypothetical protein